MKAAQPARAEGSASCRTEGGGGRRGSSVWLKVNPKTGPGTPDRFQIWHWGSSSADGMARLADPIQSCKRFCSLVDPTARVWP